MSENDSTARQASLANRALGVAGHADMVWGHASVRDPEGRGVWMKASGYAFEEISEDRVVLVTPDGDVLAGTGRRHLEYPIHTQVMAARSDVNAVVHSHATSAVTFASLDVPLRAISHDAIAFVDPDVPRFTLTGDLITTPELGDALAESLQDAAGVLIPGHGFVTVGPTPGIAVMRAVLLNRACASMLQALQAGGPARWSDEAEVKAKRDSAGSPEMMESGYRYLLRRVETSAFPITGI
jgi:ribulose-5-phosphate 4-epimerase/fuculose-1-phosphate aldolase